MYDPLHLGLLISSQNAIVRFLESQLLNVQS